MARTKSKPATADLRSARTWRLVDSQHGAISRSQLLALGYTRDAIEHRLRTGRLHRVWRGVYAVGRADLPQEGRWTAALLACGDAAHLSHRSAAALYGIGDERGRIEVTLARRGECHRPGLTVRSRPGLPAADFATHRGIPVISIVRTLLDLATLDPRNRLERAVNEADKRGHVDPEALRRAIEARAGQPGVRTLRDVLDRDTFLLSDDELELLFRPLAREAGLPLPEAKAPVNGFEVDFYWPALGLVVETDGWRYHRTPSAQARDALRDQIHTASGLTPLRFSHYQVRYEPDHVRSILRATASRLQHPAGGG
ncbi:MAG: DUF559 domain-containing protein [Syntrophothermus sp.]